MFYYCDFPSPLGITLRLTAGPGGLRSIEFPPHSDAIHPMDATHPLLSEAIRQLHAYCEARLRVFDLPLDPRGTAFQLKVWNALREIPYGETRSYRQIAEAVGSPAAVRAVGAANGRNPLPIVVPCHRVIGSNGKLVGFGGGLDLKQNLLELERQKSR